MTRISVNNPQSSTWRFIDYARTFYSSQLIIKEKGKLKSENLTLCVTKEPTKICPFESDVVLDST